MAVARRREPDGADPAVGRARTRSRTSRRSTPRPQYLQHLAAVFDREVAHGDRRSRWREQDVLLTVPASFDAVARELTVRAARDGRARARHAARGAAGRVLRLARRAGDGWRRRVSVGDLVLVCDVGGGTTDFTLIAVGERDGDLTLERVAVGEHILLGGDNMDLALARLLQQRLEAAGHRIDTWQLHGLWHQCRIGEGDAARRSGAQTSTRSRCSAAARG